MTLKMGVVMHVCRHEAMVIDIRTRVAPRLNLVGMLDTLRYTPSPSKHLVLHSSSNRPSSILLTEVPSLQRPLHITQPPQIRSLSNDRRSSRSETIVEDGGMGRRSQDSIGSSPQILILSISAIL